MLCRKSAVLALVTTGMLCYIPQAAEALCPQPVMREVVSSKPAMRLQSDCPVEVDDRPITRAVIEIRPSVRIVIEDEDECD